MSEPKEIELGVTDGGRELRAYLDAKGTTVPDFCDEHGLDRFQVQKLLNGKLWKRVSVDLAFSIQNATGGKVKAISFLSSTAKAPRKAA